MYVTKWFVLFLFNQNEGTGFKSKLGYGSGYFHIKLKLPFSHSPGVVTTYYVRFFIIIILFSIQFFL